MFDGTDVCLGKSIGLWVRQIGVLCVIPQDIQKSANWALTYCGPSLEQRALGMPCSAKHLLQQQDNLVGVALARWNLSDKDHLQVEVAHYQVVNSF